MDQNRILSFDEFVATRPETHPGSPDQMPGAQMDMPIHHTEEMPSDNTQMGLDELPMDPHAEPVVPEMPIHGHHTSTEIEEPNLPSENLSETFKKYGNKHHKHHEESRSGRCKYCGRSIENVGAGSEPRPGMCERCYDNGGDDE